MMSPAERERAWVNVLTDFEALTAPQSLVFVRDLDQVVMDTTARVIVGLRQTHPAEVSATLDNRERGYLDELLAANRKLGRSDRGQDWRLSPAMAAMVAGACLADLMPGADYDILMRGLRAAQQA